MRKGIEEWRRIAAEQGNKALGRPNPFAAARAHSLEHGWAEVVPTGKPGQSGSKIRRFEKGIKAGQIDKDDNIH